MEAIRETAEGPTVTSGPKQEITQQLLTTNFPQFNIFHLLNFLSICPNFF